MESFKKMYARAARRKGGERALETLLPKPKTPPSLTRIRDDRYLAEMTKKIFQSGFVWRVVENKWQGFEKAFDGFEPGPVSLMSDEKLEVLATDKRIIRNFTKIKSVRTNAQFVGEIAGEYGSFGKFIAKWPCTDIIGLWAVLKKRGARLGGNTGPYFLRFIGKDTFILSPDVVALLVKENVVGKRPTSKKDLAAVQAAFNQWQEQSDRPLCQISRVAAMSVGADTEI